MIRVKVYLKITDNCSVLTWKPLSNAFGSSSAPIEIEVGKTKNLKIPGMEI